MKKKYFGTDGIRGRANQFPIRADIILKIGMAIGLKFAQNNVKERIIIAKDTRLSGYMVENALASALVSVGVDVFLVGPVPTPATAMLTKSLRANAGIMISASHNPYSDNGIKIFDQNGRKLSDDLELEIEKLIDSDLTQYLSSAENIGKVFRINDARGRYIEYVKDSFDSNLTLSGLKIVIDAANGAAYSMAKEILYELGAEVISIGDSPNGYNINKNCGSTKPQLLAKTVKENKADIGIALDGDADRLLVVDEDGKAIDGDKIIGLIAEDMHLQGQLKKDTIVVTRMSNLALEKHLRYFGISVIRVNIGDRYVAEEMQKNDYNLGGEQSGHIIIRGKFITGDALVSALRILAIRKNKNKKTSQIADIYKPNPQILHNIPYVDGLLESNEFQESIKKAEKKLSSDGRILVRKSGTEPIIRIMIEAKSEEINQEVLSYF
jgi:phosphoglucosamine mutase